MNEELTQLIGKILACHPDGPQPDQWLDIRERAERLGFEVLGRALASTGHFAPEAT